MINSEDFVKRLELIFDFYGINSSAFADQIGVQRSSLSHLLSGRNKPSLDFILKLIDVFPEVDLYWITNGKGTFPKSTKIENASTTPILKEVFIENESSTGLKEKVATTKENLLPENAFNKKTEKIVIFYTDGTFKEYKSEFD